MSGPHPFPDQVADLSSSGIPDCRSLTIVTPTSGSSMVRVTCRNTFFFARLCQVRGLRSRNSMLPLLFLILRNYKVCHCLVLMWQRVCWCGRESTVHDMCTIWGWGIHLQVSASTFSTCFWLSRHSSCFSPRTWWILGRLIPSSLSSIISLYQSIIIVIVLLL